MRLNLRPSLKRFSVKGLLAFVTVACFVLGLLVKDAARYAARKGAARAMIESVGGRVGTAGSSHESTPGRNWLTDLCGLADRRESLWHVHLSGTKVTGAQLESLYGCDWIRGLYLSDTSLKDDDLAVVASLPKLRWLDLRNLEISDKVIEHLKSNHRLVYLETEGTKITCEGLKQLDDALESPTPFAEIRVMAQFTNRPIEVSARSQFVDRQRDELHLHPVPRSKRPRSISFEDVSAVSGQTFDEVRKLVSLRMWHGFSSQDRFDLHRVFRDLQQLRYVSFDGGSPSEADMLDLAKLPHLRDLHLFAPHLISDEAIRAVAKSQTLEALSLGGVYGCLHRAPLLADCPSLRKLQLSAIRQGQPKQLTDEQTNQAIEYLRSLQQLPSLESLRLFGNDLQDEVLLSLVELKQINQLVIHGRSKFLSEEALEKFKTARPDVEVLTNGVSDSINLD